MGFFTKLFGKKDADVTTASAGVCTACEVPHDAGDHAEAAPAEGEATVASETEVADTEKAA